MTPVRIENRARSGILAVEWEDGTATEFAHADLRAACPCADCRAIRRAGGSVTAAPDVRLAAIVPAGTNAVNLAFDDGHARGIYPFALLAELAATHC